MNKDNPDPSTPLARLPGVYTLFTRVPVAIDAQGAVLSGPLWAKDLELHLSYTDKFRLCCPVVPASDLGVDAVPVRNVQKENVIALCKDYGWWSVLANFVPNFRRAAQAVRNSDIVHSDGAGWAFPLSFYILPLHIIYRFQWIIVIESSFWMKPADKPATLRQWLAYHLHAQLLGRALRRAQARIFTQDGYRSFFGMPQTLSLINPAVWIDEDQIITRPAQAARIAALPDDEIRLLFPARMVADKGCQVILDAVQALETYLDNAPDTPGPRITLDLIGAGPMQDICRQFAQTHQGRVYVQFLDPVPYGSPFFSLLCGYHAVVLANMHHEQPRIIFDAFSQGVPVISSATSGVCDVVHPDKDTLLYDIGDANGLAQQIIHFAASAQLRATLMAGAHDSVQGYSHLGMHRNRAAFLHDALVHADGSSNAPSA